MRFIPAPAGNRTWVWSCRLPMTVHPRACGEQRVPPIGGRVPPGSSPRLRGTVPSVRLPQVLLRFIPAPAGNSLGVVVMLASLSVHPRACGEQSRPALGLPLSRGSSPRLRGTDHGRGGRYGDCRFIPAPAGNSRNTPPKKQMAPVHPRACGEQATSSRQMSSPSGSSPRLRGTAG